MVLAALALAPRRGVAADVWGSLSILGLHLGTHLATIFVLMQLRPSPYSDEAMVSEHQRFVFSFVF